MKSPAQAHFERVSAAKAAAAAAPGETMEGSSRYELMLAKLAADRRRLKAIQSVQQKIAVKAELLPEYTEYVDGVLTTGRGAQDDVLVTVMVWRIDAGDFAGALAIAGYALTYGLTLPDQYERSLATVVAEQFADAALAAFAAGDGFAADQLERVADLTATADMHDQVRAKLCKALGYALQDTAPAIALAHLRRALVLNERVGVKKDIDRLEKLIEAAQPGGQ
ncbi:phage terminase small subunit [Paraburkholderia phenazinium]|uniref:phage terminase small subunit n=1 Tax=Paraburkholderia phenazinium TaxID=60549 RepID=UPI00158D1C43|nr:phage terminase small subunit [Paraburkholderia phenazinium]